MLFLFPTPQYPRRPIEYVFKTLYLTVTTMHVIAITVLIADFYTRLGSTMPEYFTNSDLIIADGIKTILENCTYTGELHLQNVRGHADVSLGSLPYYLMTTAQYVTSLFVVEFLFFVNNLMTASMYSTGNRHLRIFGVHVPVYTILCCFSYFYMIAIAVVTWSFESNRQFFKRGLESCANELLVQNASALYDSEFDGVTIFTTAVYWPFGATCYSLVVYLVAAIVLAYHSYEPARMLLSEADAPWEARGVFCKTTKPLLKMHTTQRNAIVKDARKAMREGQAVRIVRSYQLMTEEDFTALETAMREQVEQMLKEEKFMKLRENFGDTESQIDQGGFRWRAQMMAPPLELDPQLVMDGDEMYGGETPPQRPAPGDGGEAFYDVDFDQYFDDNGARIGGGPTVSATEVARRNNPTMDDDELSYNDDIFRDAGRRGRGGGDVDVGFYDDEINLNDGNGNAFNGDAFTDDAEAFGEDRFSNPDFHDLDGDDGRAHGDDGDGFESSQRRHRSHRHRHRHGSSSRRAQGGDFLDEPEARRPLDAPLFGDAFEGDAYSPAEENHGGFRGDNMNGADGADGFDDEF